MLKLSSGDFLFMALGILATLIMLLMGPGKQSNPDPAAERRSKEAYLRQIGRRPGPVLTVVLMIALAAATYVGLAVYGKVR